jgi:hypothetical protein
MKRAWAPSGAERFAALAALLAAAVLAWLQKDVFFFGSFHDDAIYWLLSRSILEGSYSPAGDPSGAPALNYLPGYPLLLSLVSWTGRVWLAQALSWALTLGSAALAWDLFRRRFGPRAAAWACAWYALQPLLLRYSGAVMSDPLAVFLLTLGFWIYFARSGPAADAALALAAGFSAWVRPTGLLFAAAAAADAVSRRQFRRAGAAALGAALFHAALAAWSAAQGGETGALLGQWLFVLRDAPAGTLRATVGENAAYYAGLFPFLIVWPMGKLAGALGALRAPLSLALWGLLAWGLWRALRGPWRAVALYFLLNAGLLLFWLRPDPRYAMTAVLPAVFLAMEALVRPAAGGSSLRAAGLAFCAAAVSFGFLANVRAAAQARRAPAAPPAEYARLAELAGPDAVAASGMAATVFVHTGVRGVDFPRTYDPAEFLHRLLESGVTHLFLHRGAPPDRPDVNDWTPQARRMATNPAWYAPAGETDGHAVYAVRADPARFRGAYARFREGLAALEADDAAAARRAFAEAAALDAGLTDAQGRLARLAAARQDWDASASHLRKALEIWPEDPSLRYHLAVVEGRRADKPPEFGDLPARARRYGFWPLVRRLPS